MKRSRMGGIFGGALILLVVLAGCQQPQSLSSSADISSISVAGVGATALGVPSPDWTAAQAGALTLTNAKSRNAVASAVPSQSGSYVYYGVADGGAQPKFVEAKDAKFTFTSQNKTYLYVEVYSENKDKLNFYKILVSVVDDTPVLDDITLAGRAAVGYSSDPKVTVQQFGTGLGTPAAKAADAQAGEIWFGNTQAGKALAVTAVPMVSGIATFNFAVTTGDAAPVFPATAPSTVTLADGSYLWVKSSLTNTPEKVLFYKLKMVQKSDNRSLTSVVINGTTMAIGAMGTESFPGSENFGSYINGAQLATTGNKGIYSSSDKVHGLDSVVIQATAPDPKLQIRYDVADVSTGMKDYLVFHHEPSRTDNTTGKFSNLTSGQYLAIQVTSEIGEKGWYAFRVATGQTDATVNSATVGGVAATTGSPLNVVYGSWLQAPTGGSVGAVSLTTPTGDTTVVATLASTANLAKVEYGVAGTSYVTFINLPSKWNTTGVFSAGTITSSNNNIVMRVTSDSGTSVAYYAVKVTLQ